MTKAVLWENRDVFSWHRYDLGCAHVTHHRHGRPPAPRKHTSTDCPGTSRPWCRTRFSAC